MLKPYMGFSRSAGAEEGACLIFARTVKEAKRIGFPTVGGWLDTPWTDFAVQRLNAPHLLNEASPDKMASGTPHVIASPKICPVCEK